jgi:hypothetical protein
MGVRDFSSWADKERFPYSAAAARKKAIRRGYKRLDLGMTIQQVIATMPEPDYAEKIDEGCAWRYALETPGRTGTERGKFKTISIVFGPEHTVRKLESAHLRMY